MKYTYDQIKNTVTKKGYTFFNANMDVNIIGIRNTADKNSNLFNDLICLLYIEGDKKVIHQFTATTDPGNKTRTSPINNKGVAVVVPNQYRGVWTFGLHQGKYPALVQAKPISVYRDNDKNNDLVFDPKSIDTGFHGINCHRANEKFTSTQVDGWSAGCQVIASPTDWEIFYNTLKRSAKIYGDTFSYTLLLSSDLPQI
jgi:hypothetical protein